MPDKNAYKPPAYTIEITETGDLHPLVLGIRPKDQATRLMGVPAPNFTKDNLKNQLDDLRKNLSGWAFDYNSFLETPSEDQLKCDPAKVKECWVELAKWGRRLYRMLFNMQGGTAHDPQLVLWGQRLKKIKGARITIDSPIGHVPWGLLYDEEIPKDLGDDYLDVLLQHFWMTTYELDLLPDYPESSAEWDTTLDNLAATRMTVAINESIQGGYGLKQTDFFSSLPKDPPSLTLSRNKNELIERIENRVEPQHLIYLYCHHQKGKTWSVDDYRDMNDSKILIRGNAEWEDEDGAITLTELEDNEDISIFRPPSPPVTFLNGCTSAQMEVGDPTSFMYYFVYVLGAQAFIGAESKIPAAFADAFGRRFVKEFLGGGRIGDIMFDARLQFARDYHNPFGLYYTLYGNGNIRLTQPALR